MAFQDLCYLDSKSQIETRVAQKDFFRVRKHIFVRCLFVSALSRLQPEEPEVHELFDRYLSPARPTRVLRPDLNSA